jgi:hypothetical protein
MNTTTTTGVTVERIDLPNLRETGVDKWGQFDTCAVVRAGSVEANVERYSMWDEGQVKVEYRVRIDGLPETGCIGLAVDTTDTALLDDLAAVCTQAAQLLRALPGPTRLGLTGLSDPDAKIEP